MQPVNANIARNIKPVGANPGLPECNAVIQGFARDLVQPVIDLRDDEHGECEALAADLFEQSVQLFRDI